MTPSAWFDQEFGLITSSAIASHILRAHNKNKSKPAIKCLVSEECHCDNKLESWEAPTTEFDNDDDSCISNLSSASASRPADPTVLS